MRKFPFWKWVSRGLAYMMVIGIVGTTAVEGATHRVQSRNHIALDMPAPFGLPIRVVQTGIVILAQWVRGYGNVVYVQHDNHIETRYAHMSQILVIPGQRVSMYEVLGLIGSTGRSTGPHLHYEIRNNGKRIFPRRFGWALPIIGNIGPVLNKE